MASLTPRVYEFDDVAIPPVVAQEDHVGQSRAGVGATVWDAGLVLARYLEHGSKRELSWLFRERAAPKILELGGGTGIVGLVAARLFRRKDGSEPKARVVITDKASVMPLLQGNVKDNLVEAVEVEAMLLDWTVDVPPLPFVPDMVVLSDCIWAEELHTDLLRTIEGLCGQETCLLLNYERRKERSEETFLTRLERVFELRSIPPEKMHPTWQSEDIPIYMGRRKRQ